MAWLIVGGNGQLGKALSVVLREQGFDFCSLGSSNLDIRDAGSVMSAILDFQPNVIVNAAAWTDVDGAESNVAGARLVNADGAFNMAIAAKASRATLVHISTDYVFSGVSQEPWKENDFRSPVSIYGKTKAEGELAVLSKYPEGSFVFRTAWLYGPSGKNFAKTMTRLAIRGDDPVKVVNDQVGQPTFTLDLANQIVDAIKAELPFGIYHGTNSGQASWFEFACKVFQLTGNSLSRVVPVSSNEFVRPANRPAYSVLAHDAWNVIGSGGVSVPALRDWKLALEDAMPGIISAVKAEE